MDPPEVATAADFGSQHWSDRLAGEPHEEGANDVNESRGSNTAACTVPYIVSVDVSRAFDNIDASMLLGIIEPLLRSPEYLIIKYSEVCSVSAARSALLPLSTANNALERPRHVFVLNIVAYSTDMYITYNRMVAKNTVETLLGTL